MPLDTRNFFIFFSNTLPTSPQRLNLSKVLEHSHQLHNSTLHLVVGVGLKEHCLHTYVNSENSTSVRWCEAAALHAFRLCYDLSVYLPSYLYLYESVPYLILKVI